MTSLYLGQLLKWEFYGIFLQLKITSPEKFASFISHSEQAVKKVLQGMKQNNLELLLQGIKDNRHALATVGEDANVAIETPLLTTLYRCLARATCTIPSHLLETGDFSGEEVRDGVIHAYEFAASDAYRAVTHNKGIMNGIDPIVIATNPVRVTKED